MLTNNAREKFDYFYYNFYFYLVISNLYYESSYSNGADSLELFLIAIFEST